VLQIVSYVALFQPKLLLVDEPDNHLHPSRQALLSKSLGRISENYGATVIVATHSRHMVASAPEDAKIIWMKDGKVESDQCKDLVAVLMDIGALDQLDRNGAECIICTEDRGKGVLQKCVEQLGMDGKVKVISYNGISNAASAVAIKAMSDLLDNKPVVMIHRDRDFMNDEEVNRWGRDYASRGMKIFSPNLCDIESYLCRPKHVAKVYRISETDAAAIVDELMESNTSNFRTKFRTKRQEINTKLWKDGGSPSTDDLWPDNEGVTADRAYGKDLLSAINDYMQKRPGGRRALDSEVPEELAEALRQALFEVQTIALPSKMVA